MSDESREKGVEERQHYLEPNEAGRRPHTEEPEVEGHLLVSQGQQPERGRDKAERRPHH